MVKLYVPETVAIAEFLRSAASSYRGGALWTSPAFGELELSLVVLRWNGSLLKKSEAFEAIFARKEEV